MADRTIFVCTCEDSMAPALRAEGLRGAEQLCRAQLDRFQAELAEGRPMTVGCTQEAPLFRQEAEAAGFALPLAFANIRETAGWSSEGAEAGPKMAALLAVAALPVPSTPLVTLRSEGVAPKDGNWALDSTIHYVFPACDITFLSSVCSQKIPFMYVTKAP